MDVISVGGTIVAALVATIGILWRKLSKKEHEIKRLNDKRLEDAKSFNTRYYALLEKTNDTLDVVIRMIQHEEK